MNCPHCGVVIKIPEPPYRALRSLEVLTCQVCGKQCTPAEAARFAQDPDDEEKEPWQK